MLPNALNLNLAFPVKNLVCWAEVDCRHLCTYFQFGNDSDGEPRLGITLGPAKLSDNGPKVLSLLCVFVFVCVSHYLLFLLL